MKEVCGFKDSSGHFHDTQRECEIAESKIKLSNIVSKMDNFTGMLLDKVRELQYNNTSQDYVLKTLAYLINNNTSLLFEVVTQKADLKEAYDKELKNLERLESGRHWWLKIFR